MCKHEDSVCQPEVRTRQLKVFLYFNKVMLFNFKLECIQKF